VQGIAVFHYTMPVRGYLASPILWGHFQNKGSRMRTILEPHNTFLECSPPMVALHPS